MADAGADAVVVVHAANPFADAKRWRTPSSKPSPRRIAPWDRRKPVAVGWFSGRSEAVQRMHERQVPVFASPLDAVTGLAFGLEHRRAQNELMQMPPDLSDLFTLNPEPARALLQSYAREGRLALHERETARLLQIYGVGLEQKVAQDVEWTGKQWRLQAGASAQRLDFGVQTVGLGIDPPPRLKDEYSADVRIERKLTKSWTIFATYTWERTRSNDLFASYKVNEGLLGVHWSWEK